jgi:hypothetical protein
MYWLICSKFCVAEYVDIIITKIGASCWPYAVTTVHLYLLDYPNIRIPKHNFWGRDVEVSMAEAESW